jgi:hypothetical protein
MIKGFALASLFHKSCISFFSYAQGNIFAGFINVVVSFPPMFDGLQHGLQYFLPVHLSDALKPFF